MSTRKKVDPLLKQLKMLKDTITTYFPSKPEVKEGAERDRPQRNDDKKVYDLARNQSQNRSVVLIPYEVEVPRRTSFWDFPLVPSYFGPYSWMPPQHTTVENHYHYSAGKEGKETEDAKDEKKVERDEEGGLTAMTALAVVGVVAGVGVVGTYVLTRDENMNFWSSQLDTQMSWFEKQQNVLVKGLVKSYRDWKILFEARTKPKKIAKQVTMGSLLAGVGVSCLSATALPIVAFGFVAVASGCYLIYQIQTNKKRPSEDEEWQAFCQHLDNLLESEAEQPGADEQKAEQEAEPEAEEELVGEPFNEEGFPAPFAPSAPSAPTAPSEFSTLE